MVKQQGYADSLPNVCDAFLLKKWYCGRPQASLSLQQINKERTTHYENNNKYQHIRNWMEPIEQHRKAERDSYNKKVATTPCGQSHRQRDNPHHKQGAKSKSPEHLHQWGAHPQECERKHTQEQNNLHNRAIWMWKIDVAAHFQPID
jgi:hypothetical protein